MKTVEQRKAQLTDRLKELDAHLHQIEDELDEPMSPDVEERSVERESDEVLEGLGNAELQEVRMIQAALKRIKSDEYGYCVRCGEKISEQRLDILPATPICQKCA